MDIQLEKKKGLRPKHYGYIAIGVLLLFMGWKMITANTGHTYRTEKDKLSIAEVVQGKFDDYITINGTVAPIATIYMCNRKTDRGRGHGTKRGYYPKTGEYWSI